MINGERKYSKERGKRVEEKIAKESGEENRKRKWHFLDFLCGTLETIIAHNDKPRRVSGKGTTVWAVVRGYTKVTM